MKSTYRSLYLYTFVFTLIVFVQWLGTYVYGHIALWSIENKHFGIQPRFAQFIVAITAWTPLGILVGELIAVFSREKAFKISQMVLTGICFLLSVRTYFIVDWDVINVSAITIVTSLLLLPMLVLGVTIICTVHLVGRIKKTKRLPDN